MRHSNKISNSFFHGHGRHIYAPYNKQYIESYNSNGFKSANKTKSYVKVLQYIYDHPNCTRADILAGVYKFKSAEHARLCGRGYNSSMFSQLLYIDVIDYDKSYRYHITDAGLEVLKKSYMNDIIKGFKTAR